MLRKILGALLWVTTAYSLISSVANGSFMSGRGSTAATYGAFVGTMSAIIVNVFAGNFLMTFDEVYKKSYIEGFKVRKKQCTKIVLFLVIYALFSFGAMNLARIADSLLSALVMTVVGALPFFIPMMIFALMLGYYAIPFWNCNANFNFDEGILSEYLASKDTFTSYANDNFVLASNKVLYFPKLFCVVPFNQISSLKFYKQLGEQGVYINLVNKKKIYIATKHFERIQEAVNANRQT